MTYISYTDLCRTTVYARFDTTYDIQNFERVFAMFFRLLRGFVSTSLGDFCHPPPRSPPKLDLLGPKTQRRAWLLFSPIGDRNLTRQPGTCRSKHRLVSEHLVLRLTAGTRPTGLAPVTWTLMVYHNITKHKQP